MTTDSRPISQLHREIGSIIAEGYNARWCRHCGYIEPMSAEDAARYTAYGYPPHCGRVMWLVYVEGRQQENQPVTTSEHRLKEAIERAGWRNPSIVHPDVQWSESPMEATARDDTNDWEIRVDAGHTGDPYGYRLISAPDETPWPYERVRSPTVPSPEQAVGALEEAKRRIVERY